MWGQILTAADVGWCVGVQERVWEVMGTRNYKIACELLLGAVTSADTGEYRTQPATPPTLPTGWPQIGNNYQVGKLSTSQLLNYHKHTILHSISSDYGRESSRLSHSQVNGVFPLWKQSSKHVKEPNTRHFFRSRLICISEIVLSGIKISSFIRVKLISIVVIKHLI